MILFFYRIYCVRLCGKRGRGEEEEEGERDIKRGREGERRRLLFGLLHSRPGPLMSLHHQPSLFYRKSNPKETREKKKRQRNA